MAGNFAIGCGVMVVAGSLNDMVQSLHASVAVGGQLIIAGGGALLASSGFVWLRWADLAWMVAAIALSLWLMQRSGRGAVAGLA